MKLQGRLIVFTSLLGLVWLAGCNGTVTTGSSPVTAPEIIGNWQNADPNPSGIAQLQIHRDDSGGTLVHGYGACSPTLCDWGEAPLIEVGHAAASFYVNWPSLPGNVSEHLGLTLLAANFLQGTLSTGAGSGPSTQSSTLTFTRVP